MSSETVRVALIGMGNVGTGVARLLLEQQERLTRRAGARLELAKVVVRDISKPRELALPQGLLTDRLEDVLEDPSISVAAELMGGIDEAEGVIRQLLERGKDVVTANKALLAERGKSVFDLARARNRAIGFEAAVAGGIPIIAALGQSLTANEITSLRGIMNGTCNFIITQMEQGADYQAALSEAQRLGFAEADPAMDVDGSDAAQKLAILAHLAFGADVDWRTIPRQGIDRLEPIDMDFIEELGYRCRLLATAEIHDEKLDLQVSPTLVRIGRPLGEVRNAFNAISVEGDYVGKAFFSGLGAGGNPTASAVVADLIDCAAGRLHRTFEALRLWGDDVSGVEVREPVLSESRFYLRFTVEDHPGVLAQIAGVLGDQGISIASVVQHEPAGEDMAIPLIIMTHTAETGALLTALERIDGLCDVCASTVRMRVLD